MKTAQQWVADLGTGTAQAFPNIKRADVVNGLNDRLAKPSRIDQSNTSLCGAASLMYTLARLKPEVYAQYVTELYTTGETKLGTHSVKPGPDCKRYSATTTSGIHPADWVALASLRDSENDTFVYDSPSAEVGGITMPGDLLDWFKYAGFSKDSNVTNLVWTKDESDLKTASSKFSLSQTVCLFINANLLQHPDSGSAFPDHWVVLESPVSITKGNVDLTVYTWGGTQQVSLPVSKFCTNFYGFIACSP